MMGGGRSSSKGAVDGRAPARMVSLAVDQQERCRDGATRGLTRWDCGSARRGDETDTFPGERGAGGGFCDGTTLLTRWRLDAQRLFTHKRHCIAFNRVRSVRKFGVPVARSVLHCYSAGEATPR